MPLLPSMPVTPTFWNNVFFSCGHWNKMLNSLTFSYSWLTFPSWTRVPLAPLNVLGECICLVEKEGTPERERGWKNGNQKQHSREKQSRERERVRQKKKYPKQKRMSVFLCSLWKWCRLSSFLVVCQAWPPVSHWGSQMTALILLGSAPNQHFAH